MYTGDVIKRVLRHAGRRDRDVADAEDLTVDTVRGVRLGAGRNAQDGSRREKPKPAPRQEPRRRRAPEPVDFEAMMTTNASVCP